MVTAIIQARMGATRLPGKVLLPLGEKTVLEHVIDRVRQARRIGAIVVATSDTSSDDPIAALCTQIGVSLFRGSLLDVLDRYYQAAQTYNATDICRITADCPLIDPAVIDMVVERYEKERCDYISTGRIVSTFPDGMDTEIFSFAVLEAARKEANLPSEREHVTPFIWKRPERFRVVEMKNESDWSRYRVTLDEPSDYEALKTIVRDLPHASMAEIVRYIDSHPEVSSMNGTIRRDEGYLKSLANDESQKNQ